MPSVKVGPEFFAKARNDYRDWRWALVREFAQNSIDSGCTKLTFELAKIDGNTRLTVANDGSPMTKEIITEKLLSLGSSGKSFTNGAVGGFGKAKELLYFTHGYYHIFSGENIVSGCGGEYEIGTGEFFNGTKSIILVNGDYVNELAEAVKRFAGYAQCDTTIELTVPDESFVFTPNLKKGSPRRELDFGTVYTNKSSSNILVVRIGGIPMFKSYCDVDRCVILELNGKSSDVLTSNRDGLTGKYQEALNNFITEIAVDKKSALKNKQAKYRHYSGTRYGHHTQKAVNVAALVGTGKRTEEVANSGLSEFLTAALVGSIDAPTGVLSREAGARVAAASPSEAPYTGYVSPPSTCVEVRSPISEEFLIKNNTDLAVPKYYLPDSGEFCSYARKLTKIWGRLILQLYRTLGLEGDFAIGFLFDDDGSEAEHENSDYGRVFYLAPAEIVSQDFSQSRSWKKRFALTERDRLLSIATHEVCHKTHSWHDENYSCLLTDYFAKVLKERKSFNWCFNE